MVLRDRCALYFVRIDHCGLHLKYLLYFMSLFIHNSSTLKINCNLDRKHLVLIKYQKNNTCRNMHRMLIYIFHIQK